MARRSVSVVLEKLYSPTRRDLVYGVLNGRIMHTDGDSLASANWITTPFLLVPPQYIYVLTGISVNMLPGAAQSAFAWSVRRDNAPSVILAGGTNPDSSVNPDFFDSKACELVMMEGEAIELETLWDAGAAVNVVTIGVTGVRVPRANTQLITT